MHGKILLAPADRHMRLVQKQDKLAVECFVGDRIHGVMPAADVLFESVAEVVKNRAVGVILTGMGSDGARGLLQMRNAGCKNIGQNEASCVVYGMPKAAYDIGAINYVLPLNQIADGIMRLSTGINLLNSEAHEQADII
jgi:two-component system chemotaxis response regulator CheB